MCIRDRTSSLSKKLSVLGLGKAVLSDLSANQLLNQASRNFCLLYTSDAADERSSVDLGGRRIIKKKNRVKSGVAICYKTKDRYLLKHKHKCKY